jgi:hypothetical protein
LPRNHIRGLAGLASICAGFLAETALAESRAWSYGADFSLDIDGIHVLKAQDPEARIDEVSASFEGGLWLEFPGGASLHATLILEPVTDPSGDRYFEDFGLYAEELYLALPAGGAEIRAGKINLDFGLANDEAPGLFGDEFPGEYELTERIGMAAELPLGSGAAGPALTAAVFLADTTPLSDSLFTRRGRLHERDGGVSNTGAPQSFLLGLDGAAGATGYSAGLRYQTAPGGEADEYGAVLGLTREVGIAGTGGALLGEAAYFPRFNGAHASAVFLTAGAGVELGDAELSAVFGQRWSAGDPDGHMATIGLDYELGDALTLGAAYLLLKDEGETSHTVGLQLTFEFQLP